MGAIGADDFGKVLSREATADGVNVKYQIVESQPTGTCAVLITDNNRSLCANLAAANHFTKDHLDKSENFALVENAQYFYISVINHSLITNFVTFSFSIVLCL